MAMTNPSPSPRPAGGASLQVREATKRFGHVVALSRGDLPLANGEVHALVGSNGCGKSTLCKIIAGSVRPDSGTITLDGETVHFASPHDAEAAGVGIFYQELSLIPQRTVAQNLSLGREPRRGGFLVDRKAERQRAEALLALFEGVGGAGLTPHALVADLTVDQRQIVEILKVVAAEPRIMIFDEATAALDRDQTAVFFDLLRKWKGEGHSIVFITHRMDEIFAIADRITVMRDGVSVMTLDAEATSREEIVAGMVGETGQVRSAAHRTSGEMAAGESALEITDLRVGRVDGVTFTAHRGEIVGLGGLQGQGQSTLLRALFGALPWRDGRVSLDGVALRHRTPSAAMAHGFAYISGDRRRDGVFDIRPIFENAVAASLTAGRQPIVLRNRLIAQVSPVIDRLKLRFAGYGQPVGELSGGNQQKVVVARWLGIRPRVLLLDDPTKGIDLGAKADLYEELARLSAEGTVILLYSSEDAELLSVADRILVFNSGRIVRTLSGEEKTSHALTGAAFDTAAT